MKRIAKIALSVIGAAALVCGLGFNESIPVGYQVAWTLSCWAILALCAFGLDKLGTFNYTEK